MGAIPRLSNLQRSGRQTRPAIGENPRVSVDHYENFPVASVLCPPGCGRRSMAIYHFARTADDIADEGDATPTQRWPIWPPTGRTCTAHRLAGRASAALAAGLCAAGAAATCNLPCPQHLLHDLLDAFEQDVRNPPYPDRAALLDYCRRSANPVGRLLLHLYGMHDAPRCADPTPSAPPAADQLLAGPERRPAPWPPLRALADAWPTA
jgi:phytoene/squalene synthetase